MKAFNDSTNRFIDCDQEYFDKVLSKEGFELIITAKPVVAKKKSKKSTPKNTFLDK